ncbi:flagellar hook-associated protein 3 [Bacteriovorax stolpii]|uniref:Flagellar hook-associated protein 3 n=1 Tax=Bacteriovorax stolpii TaxID=960 RepID=A0A2K9NWZ7_BACTC|nr:flagellar hook-associated protein FlgL [Bacteriovorax stolpii]AUO00032.1 flagellar hook-associated protein 3 [Bacteriovorax stolpii]QDK39976.1 flagellar hook-associated protein 3 [Bacteriovorax stolpii]TDP54075.1 flagellar hook-associated protein 3 FlgL [Bacteriovorax stolpii]
MTRVSENSSTASLQYALNKTKAKVEDLQLKGSTLKAITRPSDNPVSNVEAMALTSSTNDNLQYLKNADFALLNLSVSEKSVEELTDIIVKAKEIAIAQSSDFFNADVRKNVANEVQQLYNQALAIANKKVGIKHIFSGTSTLTVPFDGNGNYKGDKGHISLEVSRNFFVPINLTGEEVFYNTTDTVKAENPLEKFDQFKDAPSVKLNRDLASVESEGAKVEGAEGTEDGFKSRDNIFSQLQALTSALENNDPQMIQGLLEKFDNTVSRLVTLRTRIGSITNSVESSKNNLSNENIEHASRRSALVDADVTELFSDINKQQAILKTTYQASQGLMNQSLMDFLRR